MHRFLGYSLVAALLIHAWVGFAADGDGFTQLTSNELRSQNPVFSPDGSLIAYERVDLKRRVHEIVVFNVDGSNPRPLQRGEVGEVTEFKDLFAQRANVATGFSWMPDSRGILFCSLNSGNYDLWYADLSGDGVETTQVTSSPGYEGMPTVHPSGRWAAYVGVRDGETALYRIDMWNMTARHERMTTRAGSYLMPQFSPDGNRIAVTYRANADAHSEILVYEFGAGRWTQVASEPGTSFSLASWSPDGRKLAFFEESDLAVYSFVSGRRTVVARDVNNERARGPLWSPDGDRIAYTLREQNSGVYVVELNERASGGLMPRRRVLFTSDQALQPGDLDWSGKQNLLAFRSFRSYFHEIWTYRLPLEQKTSNLSFIAPMGTRIEFRGRRYTMPELRKGRAHFFASELPVAPVNYEMRYASKETSGRLMLSAARDTAVYAPQDFYSRSFLGQMIPGYRQLSDGRLGAFGVYGLGTYGLAGYGYLSNAEYQEHLDKYGTATDPAEIADAWYAARQSEAEAQLALVGAGVMAVFSAMDAYADHGLRADLDEAAERDLTRLPWGGTSTSSYDGPGAAALSVVSYDDDARVFVRMQNRSEFEFYGRIARGVDDGLLLTIPAPPGRHEIKVVVPGRRESGSTVTLRNGERVTYYAGPSKRAGGLFHLLVSTLVPGYHQWTAQQKKNKALRMFVLGPVTAGVGYNAYGAYQSAVDDYEAAGSVGAAMRARGDYMFHRTRARALLGVAATIYAANLIDVLAN